MSKQNFEFDPMLLSDNNTNGVYLTKLLYSDEEFIEATYHEYKDGIIQNCFIDIYPDNYSNNKDLSNKKWSTLYKIIEVNDPSLYVKLDQLTDKVMRYNRECKTSSIVSIASTVGALGVGYGITNISGHEHELAVALVASLGILGLGIWSTIDHIKTKSKYEEDCNVIRKQFDDNLNKYQRIKKKVD